MAKHTFSSDAQKIIQQLHTSLPHDATFAQRKKALQNAYPWGERSGSPYKAWLRVQRKYLTRFVQPDHNSKRWPLSPLEQLMIRDMPEARR